MVLTFLPRKIQIPAQHELLDPSATSSPSSEQPETELLHARESVEMRGSGIVVGREEEIVHRVGQPNR